MTVHYTDMMISVYGGTGFVGSEFIRQNPDRCIVVPRWERIPYSNNILDLVSTVDNYNVYDKPYLDIRTNLLHLISVLEESKQKYGSNFIFNFVSSWFVYGDMEQPAKETSPCNPKGFYSITKRAAEQLLISYCETFNLRYRIFRLPNVLGLGDKKVSAKKNALQFLIKEMILGNPIKLYYGGNFYRDYMDVRDVVDAMRFLMEREDTLNQIYNICDPYSNNLFENLFNFCYRNVGNSSEVTKIEGVEFHKTVQAKDIKMDCSKLFNLGWRSKHQLVDTLLEIINEYKREYWKNELYPSG